MIHSGGYLLIIERLRVNNDRRAQGSPQRFVGKFNRTIHKFQDALSL